MPMFRPRLLIEARQLGNDYDEDCEIVRWCGGRAVGDDPNLPASWKGPDGAILAIGNEQGEVYGRPGDWIIQYTTGTFGIRRPDDFARQYEPVA